MSVPARLYDGKAAKAQEVYLTLASGRLFIHDTESQLLGDWPVEALRDENRPSRKDEVSLSLDHEDARLIITDITLIEELRLICPQLHKKRAGPKGWWKPYVYWGGGAVAAIIILFTVVLPLLAWQIAYLIPNSTQAEIGRESRDFFIEAIARGKKETAENLVCKNAEAEAILDRLVLALVPAEEGESPVSEITVVRAKQANAFALPGGQLMIFSGLLDISDHPNGFAAVLAHEMAHAQHNHPMRLFVTNAGVATVFSLLLGDVTGGTFLAALGQMTIGSGYSRDFEREADRSAIELMQGAGYDVTPMIPLMRELEKQTPSAGFMSFLDSHPGFDERIEALQVAGEGGGAALNDRDWATLRNFCK